jgi:hypothetical protein
MASFPETGDTQTLSLDVADDAGVATDPATLVLTIDPPTGAQIVEAIPHANITHPGTGQFRRQLTYSEAGMWRYRWATTSPTMGEGERIYVRPSTLDTLPASLSLEELKRRVDKKMDVDEDLLADDLAAAFLQAQAPPPYGTGRLLTPDPAKDTDPAVARTLTSTGRRVRVPDARSLATVTLDGTAVTDYAAVSRNGVVVQLALGDDGNWSRSPGWTESWPPVTPRTVVVTGRFGFAQVPIDLAGAIYQLAARWHYERQAQYADQVEVLEGTAVQSYYRQLPPRVKLVFASYAVPPAVGGLR